MPVKQVIDGMVVRKNHVYVIPPNRSMSIRNRLLKLGKRPKGELRHTPIDHFLRSLGQDQGGNAIGVILSGIGSDGTLGLKAIKAEGGVTFAQDEKSARYAGMPLSAEASGYVDFVATPEGIAKQLTRLAKAPHTALSRTVAVDQLTNGAGIPLRRIFDLLRGISGVDFSYYKQATISRRLRRRMVLRQCENLLQYSKFIEAHPAELEALFQDILIHVTGFFREPEAFQDLRKIVFPRITEALARREPIRIWVAGCSSGEEVYSIAITLLDYLGDRASRVRIQIFGTDISAPDIEKARIGIYPESSLAEIPTGLRRYFTKTEGGYQISKTVREMCVFARHDVGKDPPFSKLDLISCRNVLIYFGPVLQKRVISVFHYALKQHGFLLLGKSESISGYSNLFAPTAHKVLFSKKMAAVPPVLDIAGLEYEKAPQPRIPGEELPVP